MSAQISFTLELDPAESVARQIKQTTDSLPSGSVVRVRINGTQPDPLVQLRTDLHWDFSGSWQNPNALKLWLNLWHSTQRGESLWANGN